MSCPDNRESSVEVLGLKRTTLSESSPITNEADSEKEVALVRGDFWRVDGQGMTHRVECQRGRIWITQSGSSEDIILSEDESREFCGEGLVLIEALEESIVLVQ